MDSPNIHNKPKAPKLPPSSYFVDVKRGEVAELRSLLSNPKIQRDGPKFREVVKKVIAYMTIGVDVSPLFTDMIMATNSTDIVTKKMVYFYLMTYAEQNPDIAVLAINTLQKDCRDEDPMVRGLSLRSLCSLRIPNISMYLTAPLRNGLGDGSSYVRQISIIGLVKFAHTNPSLMKESDFIDILYRLLRDNEPQVVINAINALNELLQNEGGMVINKRIIHYLLNRIRDFSEWGQCTILELVSKYTPQSEQEMFDIMNLLEDRLKHSNSAVVLGTIKVYFHLTENNPSILQHVFQRLVPPMLTLMSLGFVELTYSILAHIRLIVNIVSEIFDGHYKNFFVKYFDPPCVKQLKLDILVKIANENNNKEIITELSEYACDVNVIVAQNSIRAIGDIAMLVHSSLDQAIDTLTGLLHLKMDYVSAQVCIVIKDLLRKYPERDEDIIPPITKFLKNIDNEEGIIAMIWILGEYGERIENSPYLLEDIIDNFSEEQSSAVLLELLTSALKLFFKRPPEVHKMLGRLLHQAITGNVHIDVHDRAMLYYSLLKYDVQEAARIVNGTKTIITTFAEDDELEMNEQIFKEFNSLSVIYDQPASIFQQSQNIIEDDDEEEEQIPKESKSISPISNTTPSDGSKVDTKIDTKIDFLQDFSDFSIPPATSHLPIINLQTIPPKCDPQYFQSQWSILPISDQLSLKLSSIPNESELESKLAKCFLFTLASGTVQNIMKNYLFCQEQSTSSFFFLELIIDHQNGESNVTFKTTETQLVQPFKSYLQQCLNSL